MQLAMIPTMQTSWHWSQSKPTVIKVQRAIANVPLVSIHGRRWNIILWSPNKPCGEITVSSANRTKLSVIGLNYCHHAPISFVVKPTKSQGQMKTRQQSFIHRCVWVKLFPHMKLKSDNSGPQTQHYYEILWYNVSLITATHKAPFDVVSAPKISSFKND